MAFFDNMTDRNLLKLMLSLLTQRGKPPQKGGHAILYARAARVAKKRGLSQC